MLDIIEGLKKELIVLFFSMTPIFELRGAIPLGISLGLNPIHSGIISIIGNILILGILLKVLRPLMVFFEGTYLFKNTIGWVKRRAMKKAGIIKRYSIVGLFFFVAIPIPTTGAWTGAVIATLLKLDYKKSFISMSMGIITAAMLVLSVYYGIINLNELT
ncbi:MAG: small multi-drug export protein [Tissierellaceae bacterium]